MDRSSITEAPMHGPFIIEEYDTTVVVPPKWVVSLSPEGFLFLERNP